MDEIYHHALKLLRRRDYTASQLRGKLNERFGEVPEEIMESLLRNRYLDDTRFADRFVAKRQNCHPSLVREELLRAGVTLEIVQQTVAGHQWLSLQDVVRAKMNDRKVRAPLQRQELARMGRALARLGYPEDEIREELDQLDEQQRNSPTIPEIF